MLFGEIRSKRNNLAARIEKLTYVLDGTAPWQRWSSDRSGLEIGAVLQVRNIAISNQIFWKDVITQMTLGSSTILICDWRGRLVWANEDRWRAHLDQCFWDFIAARDVETAKAAFARAATLHERQSVRLTDREDRHLRLWLWPLTGPEAAVCVLCEPSPIKLSLLTSRENDCLSLLALGKTTKAIAEELDIGLSTVHTHLKRTRKKLDITTSEELISFAARFCLPAEVVDPN